MSSVRSSARTLTLTLNLSNETCDYRSWALTLTLIGAFFSVQGLGAMIAGPPAGEIIALLGVRVAMVGAQGSIALVCALCALATWLPLLLVLRAVLGASLSLFQVAPPPRAQATYIHYFTCRIGLRKVYKRHLQDTSHATCTCVVCHLSPVPPVTCRLSSVALLHVPPPSNTCPEHLPFTSPVIARQHLPGLTELPACPLSGGTAEPHCCHRPKPLPWHGKLPLCS